MMDRFGRRVTYLRVSLTNRCQLACTYCTLQDEPSTVLQPGEVERLIEVCARRLGFRKIRLTGGEPTLRRDLPDVVARLAAIEALGVLARRPERGLQGGSGGKGDAVEAPWLE